MVNPDQHFIDDKELKEEIEESFEYTDGFYSSESDGFMPDENSVNNIESQLVQDNQTSLNLIGSLYVPDSSTKKITNPEKGAKIAL